MAERTITCTSGTRALGGRKVVEIPCSEIFSLADTGDGVTSAITAAITIPWLASSQVFKAGQADAECQNIFLFICSCKV